MTRPPVLRVAAYRRPALAAQRLQGLAEILGGGALAIHRALVAVGHQIRDPVVDPVSQPHHEALVRGRRQVRHQHRVARPAQQPTVGDQLALGIEQAGAGARRLDQAAHHLARQIGQQHFPFVGRVEHGALAERGGKNLALGVQRFGLLSDEARFEFAEIEKADREQRQGQDIDGNDPPRQRRHRGPAPPAQPSAIAPGIDPRLAPGGALRGPFPAGLRAGRWRFGRSGRRRCPLSGRDIGSRRHRGFRSARIRYRRP